MIGDFLDHVIPTAPGLPVQPLIDVRKALDDARHTTPHFGIEEARLWEAVEEQVQAVAREAFRQGRLFGVMRPELDFDTAWARYRAYLQRARRHPDAAGS